MFIILILFLAASFIAGISGTGGGSLFIPIFSLIFHDNVHRAIPLSKFCVLCVASGTTLTNGLTTINYKLASLLQPATLVGCVLGVFLNLIMDSRPIIAVLILICSVAAYKTLTTSSSPKNQEQVIIEAQDKIIYTEIAWLGSCWLIEGMLLFLASGPAALICGDHAQRSLVSASIIFSILFILTTAKRLRYSEEPWAMPLKMCVYCVCSGIAGICAGLLGIGGGLIKGPLLLAIGLRPEEVVATSNYMILFTSSMNTFSYLLAGRLDLIYACPFGVVCLVGASCGVYLVKKLNLFKNSEMLKYCLGFAIISGALAMSISTEVYYNDNEGSSSDSLEEECYYLMLKEDRVTQEVDELLKRNSLPKPFVARK